MMNCAGLPLLAPIPAQDLIAASSSFKERTSVTDGFHPRHLACLEPEAAGVLSFIFALAEAIGDFEHVIADVLVPLIPKLSGGRRPIGLFRGVIRIWGRARRCSILGCYVRPCDFQQRVRQTCNGWSLAGQCALLLCQGTRAAQC